MNPDDIERVEIGLGGRQGTGKWTPSIGDETLALMDSLSLSVASAKESRDRILGEAGRILARCVPPSQALGADIGLVIGYVQSGKTMSFTTVAALAADNAYQAIIVITGVSVPLLNQSIDRLASDLRLATRRDRKWQHFKNPTRVRDYDNIYNAFADWDDSDVRREERKTVLITVMKQHVHLDNLIDLLEALPMAGRPASTIKSERCSPPMRASRSRRPVDTPESFPSR